MIASNLNLLLTPFSEDTKRVIKIAQAIARENLNTTFSVAHLLKALLHQDAGLQTLLKKLDKDIYYLEEWADVRIESLKKANPTDTIAADPAVEEVISEA